MKVIRSRVFSLVVDWRKPISIYSCKELFSQSYNSNDWVTYDYAPELNVLKVFNQHPEGVVHVDHFERILEFPEAASVLNQQRDTLTKFPITLILTVYGDNSILRQLQKLMPDLWSILKITLEYSTDLQTGASPPVHDWGFDAINPDRTYEGMSADEIRSILRRRIRRFSAVGESQGNLSYQAQIAKEIAGMYVALGKPKVAARWLEKALHIFERLNDRDELLWTSYYITRIFIAYQHTKPIGKGLIFRKLMRLAVIAKQLYGNSPEGDLWRENISEQIRMLGVDDFQAYLQQNNLTFL